LNKLTKNICRTVGHNVVEEGGGCSRCGRGIVAKRISDELYNIFYGRAMKADNFQYMEMYARKILERAVEDGEILSYHDLKIMQDSISPNIYTIDFCTNEDNDLYRNQIRIS
jgi:hypothetical protein